MAEAEELFHVVNATNPAALENRGRGNVVVHTYRADPYTLMETKRMNIQRIGSGPFWLGTDEKEYFYDPRRVGQTQ